MLTFPYFVLFFFFSLFLHFDAYFFFAYLVRVFIWTPELYKFEEQGRIYITVTSSINKNACQKDKDKKNIWYSVENFCKRDLMYVLCLITYRLLGICVVEACVLQMFELNERKRLWRIQFLHHFLIPIRVFGSQQRFLYCCIISIQLYHSSVVEWWGMLCICGCVCLWVKFALYMTRVLWKKNKTTKKNNIKYISHYIHYTYIHMLFSHLHSNGFSCNFILYAIHSFSAHFEIQNRPMFFMLYTKQIHTL